MTCREARRALPGHVLAELTGPPPEGVALHVAACRPCLVALVRLRRWLAGRLREMAAAAGVREEG